MPCEIDENKVYGLAATDGKTRALLVANISGEDRSFTTNLFPDMKIYVIDEDNLFTPVELSPKEITIKNNQVFFFIDGDLN